MSFSAVELVHPVHREASRKESHAMRYPLTPIFNDLATGGDAFSVVRMTGSPFYAQNDYTNTLAEPDGRTVLCGMNAYRSLHVDAYYTDPGTPANDETFSVDYDMDITFRTTSGSEAVLYTQVITGDPLDAWQPEPYHSQTITYKIQGDPDFDGDADYDDGDPEFDPQPWVWKEHTLSVPLTTSYLLGKLDDWKAQTETFRFATDTSILDVAYATESDGRNAAVNGGHYLFTNLNPFSASLPTPSASDADLWDNNYFMHVLVTRRELMPAIYQAGYDEAPAKSLSDEGMAIYNEGFSQDQLADLITENIWRDDYGVFDDGASILNDAPKVTYDSILFADLPSFAADGQGNEIVFITRNGLRTRLTIEEIEYSYDEEEPYGEIITVLSSEQITTDPDTLRVDYSFPPGVTNAVRIGLVEQWIGGAWVAVGGEEVVGGDVTNAALKVLYYRRTRYGERWGFVEFKSPYEDRYRTKTFTKTLTRNAAAPEDATGSCGGSVGAEFALIVSQEYSAITGLIAPEEVTEFSMTVDSVDWTIADRQAVDGHVFGTTAVDTTTTFRKEIVVFPREGFFTVKMDSAKSFTSNAAFTNSKIISSEWIKLPVTVDGSYHTIDWQEIPNAVAGECVTIDGFRLSEA